MIFFIISLFVILSFLISEVKESSFLWPRILLKIYKTAASPPAKAPKTAIPTEVVKDR